ncbi:hypothetical protein K474DRAFT_1713678 [Panus rudis PR-1116 ss-1]|nr:hypothetical protein K474DRAFT_1713678 [Panus rudis PR-1116 ss-1]
MSSSGPSPLLPQELIDEIISHLTDDKPTLHSFQYVSKACLETVRYYALRKFTLRLRTNSSYEVFAGELTWQYAHLAKYIVDLTITGAHSYYPGGFKDITSLKSREDDDSWGPPTQLLSTHIMPDSLLKLLPRLASLTVSQVWLVRGDVAKRVDMQTVDAPFHDSTPSMKVSLKKLALRTVTIWKPVDFTFADILERFQCTELGLERINRDGWHSEAYPAHVNTITLPAPVLQPTHLAIDDTMLRASYIELLQRLTSSEKLESLRLTDVGLVNEIRRLGLYLASAHSSLTHLDIFIWGIRYEGEDPWESLNLSAFTNLRHLSIKIPIIGSSTTKMGFIWKAFSDFLQYLPLNTITSIDIVLDPDNTFLGSDLGVLGRMPDQVKHTLDGQFRRLLPVLERCEIIWMYQPGPADFEDTYGVDPTYDPGRYLDDIQSLLPSLDQAEVLRIRVVVVPSPEYPFYNDSNFSDDADRVLLYVDDESSQLSSD